MNYSFNVNILKRSTLCLIFLLSTQLYAQQSTSDFVFTVNTSKIGVSGFNSYQIFVDNSLLHNFDVDWDNDGVFDTSGVSNTIAHIYPNAGIETIRIRGYFPVLKFGDRLSQNQGLSNNDKNKLISIDQWGDQKWLDVKYAFSGCENLQTVGSDTIDLSLVGSIQGMFSEATSFNGNIDHWDVSSITDFSFLFYKAYAFNKPLNSWDVSSATNMSSMFNAGNIGPVTSSFNQALDNWDVSSVIEMSDMFHSAVVFNQPLNSWDVSSVQNMSWMFVNASKFNQPLDNWDVSSVSRMTWMFGYAREFNQPLNNWVMDSVKYLNNMFTGCRDFNQPLDQWNTSSVRDMSFMFQFTNSFDQPLNQWDYSQVNSMMDFLSVSNYSYTNYDSLLMHLDVNYSNKAINLGAIGVEYCNGASARARLINNGWTISGDLLRSGCQLVSLNENEASKNLSFYPNPAHSVIQFEELELNSRVQLFNSSGQVVLEEHIDRRNARLDISQLPEGIYLMRVGEASERLVVQR